MNDAPAGLHDPYASLGVRPFINTTATLTINGGSRTLPEVIAAIEQAAQFHVNLDELMEKAGARLAELLNAAENEALEHTPTLTTSGSPPPTGILNIVSSESSPLRRAR